MAKKPILFNTEMVRAILDGRKTQTRRVIKVQPEKDGSWRGCLSIDDLFLDRQTVSDFSPYGGAGNLLWLRETWAYANSSGYDSPADNRQNTYQKDFVCPVWYRATDNGEMGGPWSPSIFMPRWASRITLRVTAVRVERVQDISNNDAHAEGISKDRPNGFISCESYRMLFGKLWDSINAKRGYGWENNPWVWVVEFEVVP